MKQRTARNLLSLLLALAMVVGLLPGTFLTALAAGTTQSVRYVDAKGKDMGTMDCLPVTLSTTTLNNAWYVVNENVVFEKTRLEVMGDVNLILADGYLLDAQYGIHVQQNAKLTIWAQSTGSNMGALDAVNAQENKWDAAIGGDQAMTTKDVKFVQSTGEITINGGRIYADGSIYNMSETHAGGPGIYGKKVTINGGDVEAIGKGIGGWVEWTTAQSSPGTGKNTLYIKVPIYDENGNFKGYKESSKTTWNYVSPGIGGSEITINGGTVKATGADDGAAAIGGGNEEGNGKITINGGDITAVGGAGGAGIGSGYKGNVNKPITINGGKITITQGNDNGACIGSGRSGDLYNSITITGGDITCRASQKYTGEACVGTGLYGDIKNGTIQISGGTLNLIAGLRAPAIGAGAFCTVSKGARIIIDGGTVNAIGGGLAAGIGGGATCIFGGTIEINGGHVTATGGPDGGPGIGVGKTYTAYDFQSDIVSSFKGAISISDGTVIANGTGGGAGIGTGEDHGFVGTVTISGGTVTATSEIDGAGIGGGNDGHFGGKVTISGGEVTAKGATGGAGIGGGYGKNGNFQGTVTVTGGTVTATGGSDGGAGIGSGLGGSAADGHVSLSGGTVIAKGGTGAAGIGGGKESGALFHLNSGGEGCNDVRISGGTVFAQSGEGNCSAIGHGDDDGSMGRITFGDLLRVQTDSRTDGDIDGPYSNRDGNPYRTVERDGACMYNHTALITACDHPLDAGINDAFASITETGHLRSVCQYCGHAFEEEPHEMVNGTCVCGYKNGLFTVTFDANGGSGTMGVAKVASGTKYTLPECGFTARAGKAFVGWDIEGQTYKAGKPVEILRDTTAKAVWTQAYPLWVGGKQVTENNAGDILGDGKASYDRLSNTLTLDGAWINRSAVYDRANGLSAGIINAQSQLQIVVNGNSVVNTANADYGIYSLGALSISGTARLSVTGKNGIGTGGDLEVSVASLNAAGERYGIDATGNFLVDGSNLTARGGECGIKSAKNIGINGENSAVTARATENGGRAVQAGEDIGFDNNFLAIVTPAGGAKSNGTDDVTILNRYGDVARQVVIGKPVDYDVWVGGTQVTSNNCADVLGNSSVSYNPDTHTLTFAAAAPTIGGTHGSAMIYAGHDLTVVAPEGGLTLENANAAQGINATGDLTLRGNVTINVRDRAIFAGENFTAHGNLTARGMGSAQTAGGLIEANGSIYIEGDLKGFNRTGYGLRAGGDVMIDGDVTLNVITGSVINARESINIAGSLDNTLFDREARVSANGLLADGDIYVGGSVKLLASDTGIRSKNGSIIQYAGRWEVNNGTYGAVAMDAVKIYLPDTHEVKEPSGGAVSTYTSGDATRETISSEGNTAAYAVIDRKSDAPTTEAAVPTVQVTTVSAPLTYGGTEAENRTLTATSTVEPETGLGALYYYWQLQDEDGRWLDVADGADMTEYAVPVELAVGEYTYRCLVVNTLEGASAMAESNTVTVTIAKAAPTIIEAPRPISLTYNGKPQRLAMSGSADGGTMQYSLDGETWSGSVPTATNAGSYTLRYKVQGDENHTDLPGGTLEATIETRKLTITVEHQEKAVDEQDPELTYLVEGLAPGDMLEGQLTREAGEDVGNYSISAEAIRPADYCKDNYTLVPQGNVLTIKAGKAVAATVTANDRIYDGTEKALVTVDESTLEGGEMQYALGTQYAATEAYIASIPSKTAAGTYYVWYKVKGDDGHTDTEAKCIEVTISRSNSSPAISDVALPYTGQPQLLVNAGTVSGGTLQYALGTDSANAPADGWSTDVPTATEPGTYYVWYKVVGDENHNGVDPACIVVTIAEPIPEETPVAAPAAPESVSDYTLLASMKTSGNKAFKLKWTAVTGAEGYDVFLGRVGKEVELKTSVNGTSCKIGKLKKGKAYRAFVKAWRTENGQKVYIGQASPDVYAITGGQNNRYTNPKKITVKKKKLTVAVGGSKKIKASLKKFSNSRRYLKRTAKIRYFSSNRAVATVNAKGKVTGVAPGTCTVYAVAENGLRKGVKITVK